MPVEAMGRHKVLELGLESNLDPVQEQQWLLTRELSLSHWSQCHISYIPLKLIKCNQRKER